MSFCVWLRPEADVEKLGGKARSLLRLTAAGLRVPDAFVVTSELFAALRAPGPALPATFATPAALAEIARASGEMASRAWPAELPGELTAMLDALGPGRDARFAVRSSASIEDQAGALAAGLFLSRLEVPRRDVADALRAVLLSALSPGVVAYLARRRLAPDALGVAVLIHPFVDGDAAGTAVADPGSSAAPIIETHLGDARAAREALVAALGRLAAAHGPVEVEWVATGSEVTFLQLRPFRPTRRAPRPAAADPETAWRWDAVHNPFPLSPAQAGLVALVDQTGPPAFRQRVADGYLFYAPRPSAEAGGRSDAIPAREALADLRRVADGRLAAPAPTLEQALSTFTAIYQPLFGVVQPASRAARAALTTFLRRHGIDPPQRLPALLAGIPSAASERRRRARAFLDAPDEAARALALAAYLEAFGDESPSWDVAAATWREAPDALARRLLGAARDARPSREAPEPAQSGAWTSAAAAIADALPPVARDEWESRLATARSAVATGEDDDALYARAAAHVRYALLREAARLAAAGILERTDDIFWLPLDAVRDDASGTAKLSRADAVTRVGAAREADARARLNPPSVCRLDVATPEAPGLIRGRSGAGGTCIGPVRIWLDADSFSASSAEDVLVARTILPTELPLIAAAALVVETGGPLDHVAAQARERGIPAVVGAGGACARLADGDLVLVDGDAGLVVRLGEG